MIPFRRFQCRFACRCDSRPQKSLMRLRRRGTMELSQRKQSKSGKKREEKGKDRKKKKKMGGVELFDCFAFLLSPSLIFTVLLFFPFHTIWNVFGYMNVSALRLMGCQSSSDILGDISYLVVTQTEDWGVTTSTLVKVQTPHTFKSTPLCVN